jgi:hypothetical protein
MKRPISRSDRIPALGYNAKLTCGVRSRIARAGLERGDAIVAVARDPRSTSSGIKRALFMKRIYVWMLAAAMASSVFAAILAGAIGAPIETLAEDKSGAS